MRFGSVARLSLLLLGGAALLGCSAPLVLVPIEPEREEALRGRCEGLFAPGSWQATHRVRVHAAGRVESTLVGAASYEESEHRLDSVLLSPEGFTLLQASFDGRRIQTERAVAPLDQPAVARGMIDDLRLLLLTPDGQLELGRTLAGFDACRWRRRDGFEVVAELETPGKVRLLLSEDGAPRRRAILLGPWQHGFPSYARISTVGRVGYVLELELLDVATGL